MDTIAAISTAPGAGGIAVLRVSGPAAFSVAQACFRESRTSASAKTQALRPRHATFGTWHTAGGEALDEVLVTAFPGPGSYTGEDVLEIACHGSLYVQRAVLASCLASGARLAKAGEYTRRAYLNGRMDLTQAEGVGDLIASETAAAHRLALTQMKGGLRQEMSVLREELISFAALIELENDFGEEEVEFANRVDLLRRVSAMRSRAQALIESFATGQAIRDGVSVVLAGRPNAGKSTLLNALLGEERAIVSNIAGTTRDTVESRLVLNGVAFNLVDTAGIREATDEIEAIGVARTYQAVERASILLYVWDVVALQPKEVAEDLAALQREGLAVLGIANKMDLNPYDQASYYTETGLSPEQFVPISAAQDMNLGLLRERLFDVTIGELPASGSVILTQARHAEALRQAEEAFFRVEQGLTDGLGGDLLALDLRQAMHYIGEVTGEVTVDDLLSSIFSSFCIGK